MADTLKDLQKKIDESVEKIFKLQTEQDELQKKIEKAKAAHKSQKDIQKLNKEFAEGSEKISLKIIKQQALQGSVDKRVLEIQAKIAQVPPLSPKELKKAQEEMADYQALLLKNAAKREKTYQEEKKNILKFLVGVLADPQGLRKILTPLASSGSKKEEGLDFSDKLSAGLGVLKFAVSHAGDVANLVGSRSFYAAEAKRLMRIFDQKDVYDPNYPPFFMKLLKDPDVIVFLQTQGVKISGLVEAVAPLLAPIILKELGQIDSIEKELKDKSRALSELPAKEMELAKLKVENQELHRKRIIILEKEIAPLKDLQERAQIARVIQNLKSKNLGVDFVNDHLLPIVTETLKELLTKPQDIIDIAGGGIDFASARDPQEKQAALGLILGKIDINKLLQNGKLTALLSEQGVALSEIASVAMQASPQIALKMEELGVGSEIVSDAIQTVANVAAEVLRAPDAEITDMLKDKISEVILSNTMDKIKAAASLDEVVQADNEGDMQKLEIAKLMLDLSLKGNAAELALDKVPDFLAKHSASMAKLLPQLLPIITDKLEQEVAKLLLAANPSLDNLALKEILSPQVNLLKSLDPALLEKMLPVTIKLMDALLTGVSQDDLRNIYQNTQLLTAKTADTTITIDAQIKTEAQKQLILSSLKIAKSQKIADALAQLGDFLNAPANIPMINSIVTKAIENNPALKLLDLPPSLIESTIPLATSSASKILASEGDFVAIAESFLQFQEAPTRSARQGAIIEAMAASGAKVAARLAPLLSHDLPEYIKANKANLTEVASKISVAKPFTDIIPSAIDLTAEILPLATNSIVVALSKVPDFIDIAKDVAQYQDLGAKSAEYDTNEEAKEVLQHSRDLVLDSMLTKGFALVNSKEVMKVVQEDIPDFLAANKDSITDIALNLMKNPDINKLGISEELIKTTLPFLVEGAATLLSHSSELVAIAQQFHELVKAEDKDRPKGVVDFVQTVLDFKNNTPSIKELVDQKIPEFLTQNSVELGVTIDKFLTQTEVGRNLKSRGKEISEALGKKFPQIEELAFAYGKGERVSLIPKALKLLFSKDILTVATNITSDFVRYKYQKSLVGDSTRAKDSGQMAILLSNSAKIARGAAKDLGLLLESQVDQAKGSKSLEYSLKNRDLHGFKLDSENIQFDKIAVKGFNFDRATFGKCSFEGATLTDCSFKGTSFNEAVSFKGATIDAKSLETLASSIESYNKKHKNNPIILDEIKITGSNVDLANLKKKHAVLLDKVTLANVVDDVKSPLPSHINKEMAIIVGQLKASAALSATPSQPPPIVNVINKEKGR